MLDARPADGYEGASPCVPVHGASPYKFSADVLAALGHDVSGMGGFACMDALSELTGTEPPAALPALRDAEERFDDVVRRART